MAEENKIENSTTPASLVGRLVIKTAEELGDKLCDYCPLEKKGVYSTPGRGMAGCEGSHCDDAYGNYIEETEEEFSL